MKQVTRTNLQVICASALQHVVFSCVMVHPQPRQC